MADAKSALIALGGSTETGSSGLPNIPAVPASDNSALNNILSSMKQWMEKAAGDGFTGFATRDELVRAGLMDRQPDGSTSTNIKNRAIPPVPTGLAASGAMTTILVTWDNPMDAYGNHGYTEVWAAEANDFTNAVLIGQGAGFVFSHAVGEDATRYYWIRFVSSSGVKGPFNSVNGTLGETAKNPSYLLDVLNGQLTESQLYTDLSARIDLIDDPSTGLVQKVVDLETVYGDTVSAATSAANAAQSAADAVSAKAAAILAESGAVTAKDSAVSAKTSAQSAASSASTLATQASNSATAAAGSASSAATSATTAAGSATTATQKATAAATSATNAATSATNAETASTASTSAKVAAESAKDAAAGSASAAATSAATATTKATEAATSATSASTSATTASTKASDASTSATNAATSATNAAGSASSASTSASNAANSATAAGSSATAASTSASNASTSATNAGTSATAANTSKVAAESAKTAAESSATAASTSASTASIKANEAGQYANSAQINANDASTSAGSARNYAANAASSATDAAGAASSAASSLTQIQATAYDYNGAVQTLARTVAGPDGSTAQYTIKVQSGAGGEIYVAGIGLSSETNDAGASTSELMVVADKFTFAPVATNPAAADGAPFYHLTTPTVIDGVEFPAGTYMKSAFIADASINNAKIGSLAADKITTGTLAADRIGANTITAAKMATRTITANSAVIDNAAITNALIADAAITTAKIGDAAITSAKIENLTIGEDKIASGAITAGSVALANGPVEVSQMSVVNTLTWTNAASVNISGIAGRYVSISINFLFYGSANTSLDMRLLRGDTVVWGSTATLYTEASRWFVQASSVANNRTPFSSSCIDILPSDGTHTYTLQLAHPFASGSTQRVYFEKLSMATFILKK